MRILFCDAHEETVDRLRSYTEAYFAALGGPVPEYAAYSSPDALLAAEGKADLAFLDAETAGRYGIQLGAALKTANPHIHLFIITDPPAPREEAGHGSAFRYLSRSIDKNELFCALHDALSRQRPELIGFPVITRQGIFLLQADEIICVEAAQRKAIVYTTGSVLQSLQTMDDWRQALALPCFYIPHRSFIINMKFVASVHKDIIFLKHGTAVQKACLTKRKYAAFKECYLAYLNSVK